MREEEGKERSRGGDKKKDGEGKEGKKEEISEK